MFRAWTPIVVSLCAISLTLFQAVATRRHMRLSVQPRVDWRVVQDSEAGTITFSLVNDGFGPAVLSDVELRLDGKPVGPAGPETCAEMDRRLGRGGTDWETACFAMQGDYVLRPGDQVVLYASRPDEALADRDHSGSEIDFRRVSADTGYCSFYEECWRLREG